MYFNLVSRTAALTGVLVSFQDGFTPPHVQGSATGLTACHTGPCGIVEPSPGFAHAFLRAVLALGPRGFVRLAAVITVAPVVLPTRIVFAPASLRENPPMVHVIAGATAEPRPTSNKRLPTYLAALSVHRSFAGA